MLFEWEMKISEHGNSEEIITSNASLAVGEEGRVRKSGRNAATTIIKITEPQRQGLSFEITVDWTDSEGWLELRWKYASVGVTGGMVREREKFQLSVLKKDIE